MPMRQLRYTSPALNPRKRLGRFPAAKEKGSMARDGYQTLDMADPGEPASPMTEPDYHSGPFQALVYPDS